MTQQVSERIALVAPSAEAAAILRRDLIAGLTDRGHRVLCITPPGAGRYMRILRDIGAQQRTIEFPPQPLRVLNDWQTITSLVTTFRDWQPNVSLAFGLRTLALAAIAARRAGVRRVVSLVNGLPSDGVGSIGRRRFSHAVRSSDAIVFHNHDNVRVLAQQKLLPPNLPTLIVPGGGIDLRTFKATPLPSRDQDLVFLMMARLERRRGVLEYKSAAQQLKARWPNAQFRFAGPTSGEADAISPDTLTEGGTIEYLGHLEDVRPALAACHVFVYPSYWEGMPRAILEALATGRPVITTTAPGCVETVDEKVSGCLIPPADTGALATAMESYLANPDQVAAGSRAARLKAERRFDAKHVNASMMRILGLG